MPTTTTEITELQQQLATLGSRRDDLAAELDGTDAEIKNQTEAMATEILEGRQSKQVIGAVQAAKDRRNALAAAVVEAEGRMKSVSRMIVERDMVIARGEFSAIAARADKRMVSAVAHILQAQAELEAIDADSAELRKISSRAAGKKLARPEQVDRSVADMLNGARLLNDGFDFAHCSIKGCVAFLNRHYYSWVRRAELETQKTRS